MFSKALYKQSAKAHWIKWLTVTVATATMLAIVIIVLGNLGINDIRDSLKNVFVQADKEAGLKEDSVNSYNSYFGFMQGYDNVINLKPLTYPLVQKYNFWRKGISNGINSTKEARIEKVQELYDENINEFKANKELLENAPTNFKEILVDKSKCDVLEELISTFEFKMQENNPKTEDDVNLLAGSIVNGFINNGKIKLPQVEENLLGVERKKIRNLYVFLILPQGTNPSIAKSVLTPFKMAIQADPTNVEVRKNVAQTIIFGAEGNPDSPSLVKQLEKSINEINVALAVLTQEKDEKGNDGSGRIILNSMLALAQIDETPKTYEDCVKDYNDGISTYPQYTKEKIIDLVLAHNNVKINNELKGEELKQAKLNFNIFKESVMFGQAEALLKNEFSNQVSIGAYNETMKKLNTENKIPNIPDREKEAQEKADGAKNVANIAAYDYLTDISVINELKNKNKFNEEYIKKEYKHKAINAVNNVIYNNVYNMQIASGVKDEEAKQVAISIKIIANSSVNTYIALMEEGKTEEEAKLEATASLFSQIPEKVSIALEELGNMDVFGLIIGSIFYRIAGLLLPMVFVIMTANSLLAGQVDSGSMAYVLSTPTKRRTVTLTQMAYLITSLLGMYSIFTAVSVMAVAISGGNSFAINYEEIMLFNLGSFATMFAIAGFCFMCSAIFNRTKYSMSIGGGLSIFSFVCTILGLFGADVVPSAMRIPAMNVFNYLSIITLFNSTAILENPINCYWGFGVLFAIGIVSFIVSVFSFEKKDLPL